MPDHPILTKAPIVEAILDVQMVFPKGIEIGKLAALHAPLREHYPTKAEETMVEVGVQLQAGKPLQPSGGKSEIRGYRFFSQDKKELVQCRKDGFTFNRLAPYTSWQDIIVRAISAWEAYRQACGNATIIRIAVRYINRIELPFVEGKVAMEHYFKAPEPGPTIEGLERTGFLTQCQLYDASSGFTANWSMLAQSLPDKPSILAVVLDLDVFVMGPKVHQGNPPEIWRRMRDLKNRIFFGSLQQKTVDMHR